MRMDSKTRSKQGRGSSSRVAEIASSGSTGGALRKRERLRRRYRPDRVRILFVGEAPPVSGRFFYHGDSGLYRALRDTFVTAFPSLPIDEFLEEFRALGCYLVDLCGEPVDHLARSARMSICCAGEARLARTIRALRPMVIVTLVRSIRVSVSRAQGMAGWAGLHLELPYPGRWKHHRVEFQRQLVPILLKMLSEPSDEPAIVV
jgi:hypothetical protein